MYYDFFCNEKMLLDHFEDYGMGNRTLNRLLAQSGMPPDVCADTYLAKMDNHKGLSYDRYDLVLDFERRCTKESRLLELDKILVYRQDIDYIKDCCRKYPLRQNEVLVLFGVIMMCRILQTDTLDLTTEFALKQFCSCFDGKLCKVRIRTDNWYDTYHEPKHMNNLHEKYNILLRTPCESGPRKIGSYYTYLNYELHDKTVAYEYVITPRTNRLNMCELFEKVGLKNLRFCKQCGTEYYMSSKTTNYCPNCAAKIQLEKTKERMKRYRNRKKVTGLGQKS